MSTPRRLGSALAATALLAGCAVGPRLELPEMEPPAKHRRAATDATPDMPAPATPEEGTAAEAPRAVLSALGFWQLYEDPTLVAYLEEALEANHDVAIAVARVLEAEATARVARSRFWPTVQASGSWTTARASREGPTAIPDGVDPSYEVTDAVLAMPAYEVDLWGRLRRANEAARARLVATEEAERTVRQTVVAQVAASYFRLLELDEELAIAESSLALRQRSLELATVREEGGVASLQDVRQSQVLVRQAEAALLDVARRIELEENALSLLLGRNPGPIERGAEAVDGGFPPDTFAGLPSALLGERLDLRAAEQQLVAANADIGQAQAAFFPQITLTGAAGFQSVALSDLFTSPARLWQFGPSVTLPIFTGGRLTAELAAAEARFDAALASYRKAVQSAFREASDALIELERATQQVDRIGAIADAYRDSARLANLRYEGGVTSYLEVLFIEQDRFAAENALARARLGVRLARVELYRALGGGWQQREAGAAATAQADSESASAEASLATSP